MANILLAVTGSISAYKAADLTSQLTKLGHQVKILMTPAATAFYYPSNTSGPLQTSCPGRGHDRRGSKTNPTY